MKSVNVALIIYQLVALSQTENSFWADISYKFEKNAIQDKSTRRYYWNNATRKPDLSAAFQPPLYNAPDYWTYERQNYYETDRRNFYENNFNSKHETNMLSSFYRFMGSQIEEKPKPKPSNIFQQKYFPTPPSDYFERFHGVRHIDVNYIPPPKPIRASVVKLETIPRSSLQNPATHHNSLIEHSHNLGNILNHALIETFKKQHHTDLSFHSLPFFKARPDPFVPTAVLPTPINTSLTTAWIRPKFGDNQTVYLKNSGDYNLETLQKTVNQYPHSIQDQLPPTNLNTIKIINLPKNTMNEIFTNLTISNMPPNQIYEKKYYFEDFTNTPRTTLFDSRLPLESDTKIPVNVTQTHSTIFTEFTPKTNPTHKASIERITNLTVQGLLKTEQKPKNIHDHFNQVEIRNLIAYEMSKLESTPKENETSDSPPSPDPKNMVLNNSSARLVNLNDELSLDAKILKDTDWDGLTSTKSSETTLIPRNTHVGSNFYEITMNTTVNTTRLNITNKVILHNDSCTQVDKNETNLGNSTKSGVTELISVTDVLFSAPTTNESSPVKVISTGDFTKAEIFNKTEQLKNKQETTNKFSPSTEAPVLKFTDATAIGNARRKYNRRPKVTNLTQYPTTPELQNKAINRSYYPKRSKPNITLTFGNKNITKIKTITYGRDEEISLPNENNAKKTKKGKRRQLIKRKRITTTEAGFVSK